MRLAVIWDEYTPALKDFRSEPDLIKISSTLSDYGYIQYTPTAKSTRHTTSLITTSTRIFVGSALSDIAALRFHMLNKDGT